MSSAHLITAFTRLLQWPGLPEVRFFKTEERYQVQVGEWVLSSRPLAVRKPVDDSLLAYDVHLTVRTAEGQWLDSEDFLEAVHNTSPAHIVKIIGSLHLLNVLAQRGQPPLIILPLHPSVFFDTDELQTQAFHHILTQAGLTPQHILWRVHLPDDANLHRYQKPLLHTQAQGYQLGVELAQPADLLLLERLNLEPDALFFHVPKTARIATPRTTDLVLPWLDPLYLYKNSQRILIGESLEETVDNFSAFDGYFTASNTLPSQSNNQHLTVSHSLLIG